MRDVFDHQDVAANATDNRENCELATRAADILTRKYVPLAGGTPFPGTEQRPDDGDLRELITKGTACFDDLPKQLPNSQTTFLKFGDYPARQEQNEEGCVLAIETGTGQVLGVSYTNNGPTDTACPIAGARLAVSISDRIW